MEWLKWHIGSAIDPKFSIVARRSGHNVAAVIAIWAMLLERAGQAEERGSIMGFDCEAADVALGLPDGAACAIIDALQSKGLIHGDRVANWEKRQSTGVTEAARERKRLQREREKLEAERLALERRIAEVQAMGLADSDSHAQSQNVTEVTTGHRGSQDVTGCHKMSRKKREDKKRENTSPPVESLVNQDRARSPERRSEGGGEEDYLEPAGVDENTPSVEFQELRAVYNKHGRVGAPLAGLPEYLALKKSRQWPGQAAIYDAIDRLSAQDGPWREGKAPGLAKFLKEQWWRMKPRPPARASPPPPSGQTVTERNMATARQVLTAMEAEHGK